MLNKNIVHLIDDIFWNMGFKTETHADKVMHIIPIISIISLISIMRLELLQVRQDLGLADHVWQDKRTLIAQSVDNLGDQFRTAMRAGWLHTSVVRTQRTARLLQALLWEKAPSSSQVESTPLLDAMNNVPP